MHVLSIGAIAARLLARERTASVMGITSRGLFLRLDPVQETGAPPDEPQVEPVEPQVEPVETSRPASQSPGWIIFLSTEPFRGPLTLNVSGDHTHWLRQPLGSAVHISAGRIVVPQSGLDILLPPAFARPRRARTGINLDTGYRILDTGYRLLPHASHPSPPSALLPPAARRARLDALTQILNSQQPDNRWLVNFPQPRYDQLRQTLAAGHHPAIAAAAAAFLGLGSGLTPSGDDLICGLLLALNRYARLLAMPCDAAALAAAILPLAYTRTTLLSANLIECAAAGLADERILFAFDGWLTGERTLDACAASLTAYGHSSGWDMLAGAALVLI